MRTKPEKRATSYQKSRDAGFIRHPHGLGANIMARLFGFGVKRPRTSRLVQRMYVADGNAVAR